MQTTTITRAGLWILYLVVLSQGQSPVPLIIDTDASFDVDDVVAICMAHALMDKGEVDIKAIVHDAGYPRAIGAVSVLNTYYGREDIPLGAYKGDFGKDTGGDNWVRGAYVDDLVDNWPSPVKDSGDVPDAVSVYRKVLAAADDRSIVISSIGFVTNLADLLRSGPDEFSTMNGFQLVEAKVKAIAWQGGWYPPLHGWGVDTYNWNCGAGFYDTSGCRGESAYAVNNMPASVEMIFSDIGDYTYTGGRLSSCSGDNNPCRAALIDQCGWGNGRCSWDPIVTLHAVRYMQQGTNNWEEHRDGGKAYLEEDGSNYWTSDGGGYDHAYLVLDGAWDGDEGAMNRARDAIATEIDDLLCNEPDPPEPEDGGPITNPLTNFCLNVQSSHPSDYTNVNVEHCSDALATQQWTLKSSGEIHHSISGKCLDMDANNENAVEVYSCSGVEWQKWEVQGDYIINKGTGRCLDIKNCPDGCESGADVWGYDCINGENQKWDTSKAGN